MGKIRKIVEIDEELCDGCGMCALACAEGALEIIDGKARIVKDSYCDGLGACLSGCPTGAVRIVEREAAEFDPEEVEEHLAVLDRAHATEGQGGGAEKPRETSAEFLAPRGCPSSRIEMFTPERVHGKPADPQQGDESPSELSHWPVQIRLVPPTAPFLKRAHLLIVSDCAPVALPDFHRRFVRDKAVLLGCPKFDDVQEYVAKFTEIFRTADIRSVTVLYMEVPCCSAMPMIVQKAMKEAGKQVPFEEILVGLRGKILKRNKNAA